MLTTRLVEDERAFADMAPRWRALLDRAVDANTFLSHEWLFNWWCGYRPAARLCIVVVELDGRPAGIAPMMLARETRMGLPFRVLRFIGDGTWETDHMNFLVGRGQSDAVVTALLDAISAIGWDVAFFNQMPEKSPLTRALLAYATRRSWSVSTVPSACPRRNLPATYEELLSAMPARFRTSLRSSRRRLQQRYAVEFGQHDSVDELPAALDTLFTNHTSRWQTKGQDGVFGDPRKRDFYARLTPALLARGALRFFYLKLDGHVVAQQYCFEHDGTVMLLQEGFDARFAEENVGNTLRGFVFEHLIGQGAKVYDFLAGVSRHKQNWSDASPNDLRIECARGVRGALYAQPPRVASVLKRKLRSARDGWRRLWRGTGGK